MIKSTKKYILSTFLILNLSSSCLGSNWYQIDNKSWIDLESIKRNNDNVLVWQKDLNSENWSDWYKKHIWYNLGQYQYSCTNRQYEIVSINSYDFKNVLIFDTANKNSNYHSWIDIMPDSINEKTFNYLCK